jgi:hypothetical protein
MESEWVIWMTSYPLFNQLQQPTKGIACKLYKRRKGTPELVEDVS